VQDVYTQVAPAWFAAPVSVAPAASSPAVSSMTAELNSDSAGRWIVRLSPEAVAQVQSVDGAAALLDTGTVNFTVIRGLGLPGQVLVAAAGSDAAAVARAEILN